MARHLATGGACGLIWGVAAAAVFVAMFRGALVAPGDVAAPVAIGLIVLYLPFVVAAGVEAAAGRGSAPFPEIIGATVAAGVALGLLAGAAVAMTQSFARNYRPRN